MDAQGPCGDTGSHGQQIYPGSSAVTWLRGGCRQEVPRSGRGCEAPGQAPREKVLGNRRSSMASQIPATRAWAIQCVNGSGMSEADSVPGILGSMDGWSFPLWDLMQTPSLLSVSVSSSVAWRGDADLPHRLWGR